jgi:serine/threonine-protein kinase PknG
VPGVVPENKRYCSHCDQKLNLVKGFCPKCGQAYSFVPTLQPADMVAGKYQVKGTLAFGGLGWIYLAHDTLLRRRVVLKGLLNTKDPNLLAVAVQEREFLASVDHPGIVEIYDFITHGDQGFIVMEYVNGRTLMNLRKDRRAPLAPAEACSYILGVLPALGYLDEHDLVYCDFKPENVMVTWSGVKLIDMGGVRRVDDTTGDVYGTDGYAAPEAGDNPTPVSDLYCVGRALAVLVADFDFRGEFKQRLPLPNAIPAFQQNESLYRFLLKATRTDPDDRFQTAEEMADQLLGVVRELSVGTVDLGPVDSPLFGEDPAARDATRVLNTRTSRAAIPTIKVDPTDPAARIVTQAAAVPDRERRRAMFERSLAKFPASEELPLRIAGELIETGSLADGEKKLAALRKANPRDWRITWLAGRAALAEEKLADAQKAFEAVALELPGELAPKLALAVTFELMDQPDRAIRLFDLVSRIDPMLTSAAFGLGRCLLAKGDRAGAVAAYERVPVTSSRYTQAQLALIRALIDASVTPPGKDELNQAADAVEGLRALTEGLELHRVTAELYRAAIGRLETRSIKTNGHETLLGQPFHPIPLRLAAEKELRACARLAATPDERIALVDAANQIRPRTWL